MHPTCFRVFYMSSRGGHVFRVRLLLMPPIAFVMAIMRVVFVVCMVGRKRCVEEGVDVVARSLCSCCVLRVMFVGMMTRQHVFGDSVGTRCMFGESWRSSRNGVIESKEVP